MGDTHRTTYHKNLLFRSKDRLQATTASSNDFKLRFSEAIEGKHVVRWATIPNTLYNVNSSNNQVYFDDNTGGPYAATITAGNYTGATLATALKTTMDAASVGVIYTVTFNNTGVDNKIEVTPDAGNEFQFTWATGDGTTSANSAAIVLGYVPNVDTALSGVATALTAPGVVFLGCPLSLGVQVVEGGDSGYVTSGGSYQTSVLTTITKTDGKVVTSGQQLVSSSSQGSLIVPLLVAHGVYNFTSHDVHKQYLTFPHGVHVVTIRVVDPGTNELVDLNNGSWEMLLERVEDNITPSKRKRR